MDGYGRDYRGGRGPRDQARGGGYGAPRRGGDERVWYVPDAEPQAGMFPGPWGSGRFAYRRGGQWYDEDYAGHTGTEGLVWERAARRRGQPYYVPDPRAGRYDEGFGPGGGARVSDADRICAWQIMTEDPEAVTPDTTLADVSRTMRELDVGIIPVVRGEGDRTLLGVITDRDIVVRALAEGKDGSATVRDHMTTEVSTVGRNDTVHDVLDVMKRERVRRVPVCDEGGRLIGIIAQADLAVSYAGLDLQRESEVEETIERISEPVHRGRSWGRAFSVRRRSL